MNFLEIFEGALRTQLSDMVRQHQTDQDKISSLTSENSRLVTECDALATTVKTWNGSLVEAKKSIEELDVKHGEDMETLKKEKDELDNELKETKVSLGQLEDESLKLFEEGYRECWGRVKSRGLDVESDSFETYLGELKGRIKEGTRDAEEPAKTGGNEA